MKVIKYKNIFYPACFFETGVALNTGEKLYVNYVFKGIKVWREINKND